MTRTHIEAEKHTHHTHTHTRTNTHESRYHHKVALARVAALMDQGLREDVLHMTPKQLRDELEQQVLFIFLSLCLCVYMCVYMLCVCVCVWMLVCVYVCVYSYPVHSSSFPASMHAMYASTNTHI